MSASRITGILAATVLLGLSGCSPDTPPEEEERPSAAPQTTSGAEPAAVPPPPGTDTLAEGTPEPGY